MSTLGVTPTLDIDLLGDISNVFLYKSPTLLLSFYTNLLLYYCLLIPISYSITYYSCTVYGRVEKKQFYGDVAHDRQDGHRRLGVPGMIHIIHIIHIHIYTNTYILIHNT
jgi:hypothetical protein